MEKAPNPTFFVAEAPHEQGVALRNFFLDNGMSESADLDHADLVIHETFRKDLYNHNQYWVILGDDLDGENYEGLFFTSLPQEIKLANAIFRQIKRSFLVWYKYQQMKDHLVVPKTYLEIFSQQIQVQLKGMSGLSNILREGYLSDLQREKYADYISGNANRLQNFFANLWEYYQFRDRKRTLKVQKIKLNDLLNELHERFQRILKSQGKEDVDFCLELCDCINEELDVRTDKRRLVLILSNLLDNAVRFTENGTICWKACIENEHLEVQVENNNIPEQNPIISEAEENQLGIGLLVGHYNAEIIRGKLDIDHNENQTCATLRIPLDVE